MATLYVENIPDSVYEALRRQARDHRRSMAQEVLGILEQQVPTPGELARRKRFLKRLLRQSAQNGRTSNAFPSSEEMIREDRSR